MSYTVTTQEQVNAESPEAAALEVSRLWRTTRPQTFDVSPSGGIATVVFVVRVEREKATLIA